VPDLGTTQTIRWFALAAALSYLAVGVTHLLLPRDQLHLSKGISPRFFESLAASSRVFRLHYWLFVAASLSALGVALGLSNLIGSESLLGRMATVLGVAGLLVASLDYALMQSHALRLSRGFRTSGEQARAAMVAAGLSRIDPTGLFSFALVGAWFAAVASHILRSSLLPHGLGWLGLAGAAMYEMVFLGTVLHVGALVDIAAAAGCVVVGPAWFIWLSLALG